MNVPKQIILELGKTSALTPEALDHVKRKIAGASKQPPPSTADLLSAYRDMVSSQQLATNSQLERLLRKRDIRTLSGVAIVTTLLKPFPCPGQCTYCPTEARMPNSYVETEPAAQRALHNAFDPYKQVWSRLQALVNNGHPVDKIEMIIKGGTWSAYSREYQVWFVTRSFESCNDFSSPTLPPPSRKREENFSPLPRRGETKRGDAAWYSQDPTPRAWNESDAAPPGEYLQREWQKGGREEILQAQLDSSASAFSLENFKRWQNEMYDRLSEAQKINEATTCRVIGLTLETRPDWVNPKELAHLRRLGTTRVEIGAQAIDDEILLHIKRGHDVQAIKDAARLLRNAGFKCDFHMMPQLPGTTPKKDVAMFKELFDNPDLRPDMVKIYPCVVLPTAELYQDWKSGAFKPYATEELVEALIKIKTEIPRYCRLSRLIRDIPSTEIAAGNMTTNLRELIQAEMKKRGLKCNCLRCREVGHVGNQELGIRNYEPMFSDDTYIASGGEEHFLSIEDKERNVVYAFCRLRLPKSPTSPPPSWKREEKFLPSVTQGGDKEGGLLYSLLPELKNAALIRELHTYGHLIPILDTEKKSLPLEGGGTEGVTPTPYPSPQGRGILDESSDQKRAQHLGLGRELMSRAEEIARKVGYQKMAVIAGVGAREYYRKLGYELEGTYMTKALA